MNPSLKHLVPLLLLCSFGCINVPEVDQEPDAGSPPDRGDQAGFALNILAPTQASVFQGGSHTFQLSLNRTGGFAEAVSVSLDNPPAGIFAQPVTIPAESTSASLVVTANTSAAPGTKILTVRATAGTRTQEAPVELTVTQLGDLQVQWKTPTQNPVYVKDSIQLQLTVEGGTAESVELLKGSTVLAQLQGPSYQYTWDTTQEPEGLHQLTARAKRGGSTFTSPARTITVDRQSPSVEMRTPAPGAPFVSARTAIQVRFSEALDASTVRDSTVVLSTEMGSITKTLSLSADGKALTLTPASPLAAQSTVTIMLGTASGPLADMAGNALAASTPWTFTIPAWLPMGGPLSANSGNTPAENVTMRVGADGNPVVAWSETDGASKNIYVQRWNGSAWEPLGGALSAFAETGTHADEPALELDTSDLPIVVWHENKSGESAINIHGKRWSGTWAALPEQDATSGNAQRLRPAITLDRRNNTPMTFSSYYDGTAFTVDGYYWLNPQYNTWTSQFYNESSALSNPEDTQIVMAMNSTFIAYSAYSSTKNVRGIAVHKDSPWVLLGNTVVTSPLNRTATRPSLVLDGGDNPYLAWQDCPESSSQSGCQIHAAFWTGSGWQPLGSAVSSPSADNTAPSMVMGDDGRPFVAWSGFSSPERTIWVSRWTGSTWQPMGNPLSAVAGTSTAGVKPVLGLDKNGQPLVAWQEFDGSVSNIYVYRYNY